MGATKHLRGWNRISQPTLYSNIFFSNWLLLQSTLRLLPHAACCPIGNRPCVAAPSINRAACCPIGNRPCVVASSINRAACRCRRCSLPPLPACLLKIAMKSVKANAPPVKNSKFKPKKPEAKKKSAAVKVDQPEIKADLDGNQLLRAKLNSAKAGIFGSRRTADGKSAPVEVAFGQKSASTIKKFGDHKRAITASDHEDHAAVQSQSKAKEYIEPWDYENSNYPISLPLRLPNLGDPEILDKEEFEREAKVEESMRDAQKEERRKLISPAEELGLMDANEEQELFFFQFPEVLPFSKRPSAGVDQKSNIPVENANTAANLKDLPSGRLGKMMVYRSGKMKMKIGDTLFDVSPGQNCMFAQDAAVISVKEKKCCILKSITRRVVVTPDIDALLQSVKNM